MGLCSEGRAAGTSPIGADWLSWHEPYLDASSLLSRRLRLVQGHIDAWLDDRPGEELTAVSACAGQGHDLLGVLAARPDAGRVRATLLEHDERNVDVARVARERAGLTNVVVVKADAGERSAYSRAVPADLVLLVGVFGNLSDGDVRRTVAALPELCAPRATVIWTRTRRLPDLTPDLRSWLEQAGFVERAFHAPDDVLFSVGVHQLEGAPKAFHPVGRLFSFIDRAVSDPAPIPVPADRRVRQDRRMPALDAQPLVTDVDALVVEHGSTRYTEFVRVPALSLGLFAVGAGHEDSQSPHAEDEVYVVVAGRATLVVDGERTAVAAGSVAYVPARVPHRFEDVTEDLRVYVVFAPPETST